MIGQLNLFLTAIRRHHWADTLPTSAMFFPEDFTKQGQRLPRALSDHVMAQLELPSNLDCWDVPEYRLVTVILTRCGLRITDALGLPVDGIVRDADGAPYLRYFNDKMKREALVPVDVDEELESSIGEHCQRLQTRWSQGAPRLFPKWSLSTCNAVCMRPRGLGDLADVSAMHRQRCRRERSRRWRYGEVSLPTRGPPAAGRPGGAASRLS
jgi:hypothetical protein